MMDLERRLRLIEHHIGDPSATIMPGDAIETLELARRVVAAASAVAEASQRLRAAGLAAPQKLALEIDCLGQLLTLALSNDD